MMKVEKINYCISDSMNINKAYRNRILVYDSIRNLWALDDITYDVFKMQYYINKNILIPVVDTLINY